MSAKSVPYRKILTSRAFWKILFAEVTFYWYINTSFVQMPSYLIEIQGFSVEHTGRLLAISTLSGPFWGFIASFLADKFINNGIRTRTVRRSMQAIGVFIPGFS